MRLRHVQLLTLGTYLGDEWVGFSVFDHALGKPDILRRCFRFRYETTWSKYYAHAVLSSEERDAIRRHALGTIAIDIPAILTFFLLLATRPSLPRRPLMLDAPTTRNCY
jgi:hypothetical protein